MDIRIFVLTPNKDRFIADLSEGKKVLSEKNKFIAGLNYEKVMKHVFSDRE